jgi:hypothetical protein
MIASLRSAVGELQSERDRLKSELDTLRTEHAQALASLMVSRRPDASA